MPEHDVQTGEGEAATAGATVAGPGPAIAVAELFTDGSRSAELREWAAEKGAERPAVLLAAQLARGIPYATHVTSEGQSEFVGEVLRSIDRGGARGKAARRWLLWLWAEAPDSLRSRFADEQDLRAAECVMDMHRRAIAGEPDVSAWRHARKRFRAAVSAGAAGPAVEAVLSSMWDLETTPGAIADVAATWITESTLVDAVDQMGWSLSELERVQTAWNAFGIEFARIARAPGEGEAEFNDRKQKYMQENPPSLSEDDFAMWKSMEEKRTLIAAGRVADLRRGLLLIMSAGTGPG